MFFSTITRFLPLCSQVFLLLASTSLAKDRYDDASDTPDITWQQPIPGSLFKPGDTFYAQWTSEKEVVSPSFRLCGHSTNSQRRRSLRRTNKHVPPLILRDNGDCGQTIWPGVQQFSNGTSSVGLVAPDVSAQRMYHLVMEDDFGSLMQSPPFSVSQEEDSNSDTASTPTSMGDTGPIASDLTSSTYKAKEDPSSVGASPTSDVGTSTTNSEAMHTSVPQQSATLASTASPSVNSTAKSTATLPKGPIYIDSSNLLSHSRPTPVAAFAIPLVAAAAALLVAGCLAIKHRRTLLRERGEDELTLKILDKLRRSRPLSASTSEPPTLPSDPPQLPQIQPIPLFMPIPVSLGQVPSSDMNQTSPLRSPKVGDTRQSTRRAFPHPTLLDHTTSYINHSNRSGPSLLVSPTWSRSRNLSIAGAYTIPSSEARSIRGCRPLTAPYLPPLSFSPQASASDPAHNLTRVSSSISSRCATSDILEGYCLPSPHLGSASGRIYSPIKPPPLPPSLISAPQRLHVRDEAPSDAPTLSFMSHGHSPASSTRISEGLPGKDVYAAVASLLNRT